MNIWRLARYWIWACLASLSVMRAAEVAHAAEFNTNRFLPLALDSFYDHPFTYFKTNASWGLVPSGVKSFSGVPFRMFGQLALTGLGPARDHNFHPTRVSNIPAGWRAARLHLIHGAAYDALDGTPIAALRLNYANGQWRQVLVRYGVHVRNWYSEKSERTAFLSDPGSSVIWNGNSRQDGTGTPTRLFKSTFNNPLPSETIASLDLLSTFARANSVIIAVTLEAPAAGETPAEVAEDEPELELRREMLFHVFEEPTQQPISNAVVDVTVSENGRLYGFGSYKSSKHGQILFDYPPGKFEDMTLRVNALDSAVVIGLTDEDGIYPDETRIPLRRSTRP